MPKIKTLAAALKFVERQQICTLFSGNVPGIESLWDAVDLPEDNGRTKWGQKIEAVWAWKNDLPGKYPDRIFYGKLAGGQAVFMSIDYLRDVHYPQAWQSIDNCSPLAQEVFQLVKAESDTTSGLRKRAMAEYDCTKSRFETALKQLQSTLNIARSNGPGPGPDTWVPFTELYAGQIG